MDCCFNQTIENMTLSRKNLKHFIKSTYKIKSHYHLIKRKTVKKETAKMLTQSTKILALNILTIRENGNLECLT